MKSRSQICPGGGPISMSHPGWLPWSSHTHPEGTGTLMPPPPTTAAPAPCSFVMLLNGPHCPLSKVYFLTPDGHTRYNFSSPTARDALSHLETKPSPSQPSSQSAISTTLTQRPKGQESRAHPLFTCSALPSQGPCKAGSP